MSTLELTPVSFADACAFVDLHHRHNKAPVGHKFSIGVAADGHIVGVAMVGRPVARMMDDGLTLEVNRTATDGTPNANSMLYGAAWRATQAMGYRRLITYTQHEESGASLRAAGWKVIGTRPPRPGWTRPSRPRKDDGTAFTQRTLWEASHE
jgi:antitoxin (DNA-binding transcriptional repressor) of toxin-antitoxin stability system